MASSSSATTAGLAALHPSMDPQVLEWMQHERKISRATLARLPVASGTAYFPQLRRQSSGVFFKYRQGWKARAVPDKAFVSAEGTKASFWNLEAALAGKMDSVFITEGEMDCSALVECGLDADEVIAAPSATEGEHEYAIEALQAGLNRAKKYIWCGDQDEAGLRLRAAMVKIFGSAKFHFLEWPEGIKDGNESLIKEGPRDTLDRLRNGVKEWPIDGLYRLDKIPEQAPLVCWPIGFHDAAVDERLRLAAGTLSVVTGHPGHGKTMLFSQIWFQVIREQEAAGQNLVACIASFETRPKPHLRQILRTLHGRELERLMLQYHPEKISAADAWINDHYLFAIHPERRPDLGWLMDKAEGAVMRHGARILQVDPWNRLEGGRRQNESETDYIGRCLRELYNFAVDFNCHVQIIAHPSKSDSSRRGKAPELEDIHGSKHWDNMPDQGLIVYRPRLFDREGKRETGAVLYHRKARFHELGYPTKIHLNYDIDQGRFGITEAPQPKKVRRAANAPDDNQFTLEGSLQDYDPEE